MVFFDLSTLGSSIFDFTSRVSSFKQSGQNGLKVRIGGTEKQKGV